MTKSIASKKIRKFGELNYYERKACMGLVDALDIAKSTSLTNDEITDLIKDTLEKHE